MNIGIDKIAFYTPEYYVDMVELAHARGIDPNKYTIGLGQEKMSVAPITQDTITMGANAAIKLLNQDDKDHIDMIIFCTESGLDFSKSGATVIHRLLKINPFARAIEMKQACYSATAALQMGKDYIATHPGRKVLVIASDISKYGLNSGGEPTQGAGAVAMLVSDNPGVLSVDHETTFFTDDIHDFWRPNYSEYAIVDGKFSNEAYQRVFTTTLGEHLRRYQRNLNDYDALVFHIPYAKMGLKALKLVANETDSPRIFEQFKASTYYNKNVGNIYTASLFLSLMGLLQTGNLVKNARIGMFSYGSGAVGEFFSGVVHENFSQNLISQDDDIKNRKKLSIKDYEAMFLSTPNQTGMHQIFDTSAETSTFFLKEIKNHIRIYNI